MESSSDVMRISAQELQEKLSLIILDASKSKNFAIIDVRSGDFPGGHIPSADNIPCNEEWERDEFVDEIVMKYSNEELIICHCMLSQQRGPYCANRLTERIQVLDIEKKPRIAVLNGGFRGWKNLYEDAPGHIEH